MTAMRKRMIDRPSVDVVSIHSLMTGVKTREPNQLSRVLVDKQEVFSI
ncbi:MAG: hypothetical protein ACREBC_05010 [Pyrinomonadaceae bacterium]